MASPISFDVVLSERGPEDDSTAVAVGSPYKIDEMKFGREVTFSIATEVVSTKTDEVLWAEEDELLPFSEDVVSVALPGIGEDGSRDEALLTAPPAVEMTSTTLEDDRTPGDSVATALELAKRPTEKLAAVVVENSTPVERLLESPLEV